MVPSSTKWLKARNTTFTQALGPAKSTSKCFRNLECFLSCNNQSPSTACHSDCCENFLTCFSVIASSKVPLKSILWDESKIVQMQIWPPWILWLHFCLLGPAGTPLQYFYLENPMDWGAWVGYSSWGRRGSDRTEATEHDDCTVFTIAQAWAVLFFVRVLCNIVYISGPRQLWGIYRVWLVGYGGGIVCAPGTPKCFI